MNKLINIVLSGLLWRRYQFLLISIGLLIVCVFLIGKVHEDYLAYMQTTEQAGNIGASFLVKWSAWALSFIMFIMANHIANKNKEKQTIKKSNNKTLKSLISGKFKLSTHLPITSDTNAKKTDASPKASSDDAFDHLREKGKLRSYADLLIEKHDKSNEK